MVSSYHEAGVGNHNNIDYRIHKQSLRTLRHKPYQQLRSYISEQEKNNSVTLLYHSDSATAMPAP